MSKYNASATRVALGYLKCDNNAGENLLYHISAGNW